MKDEYIRIMVTKEQKNFIKEKAKEDVRTMTAVINKCIKEKYNDYPID